MDTMKELEEAQKFTQEGIEQRIDALLTAAAISCAAAEAYGMDSAECQTAIGLVRQTRADLVEFVALHTDTLYTMMSTVAQSVPPPQFFHGNPSLN